MRDQFYLQMCSDLSYEGMVIDIRYEDKRIASVNYDKGVNNMEIEIFQNQDCFYLLDDFMHILRDAKELAIKCAKEDGVG